jgi:hypothetical protein
MSKSPTSYYAKNLLPPKKPTPPEKMTDLLNKIRKGATSSISLSKIVEILHLFGGWKLAPASGWIADHRTTEGGYFIPAVSRDTDDPARLEQEWKEAKANEASSPPTKSAKFGDQVTMDVEPIKILQGSKRPGFAFKRWFGVEGLEIESPTGARHKFLPGRYDIESHSPTGGTRIPSFDSFQSDVIHWLKEKTNFLDLVNQRLGTEAHQPSVPRTRENTGTCPVCFGNYKLDSNGLMVTHGYRRPGHGFIVGNCHAANWRTQPLEVSPKGVEMYIEYVIDRSLGKERGVLAKMAAGEIYEVLGGQGRKISRGDTAFPGALASVERQAKEQIAALEEERESMNKILAAWKPRPLPVEGEISRGVRFFLK